MLKNFAYQYMQLGQSLTDLSLQMYMDDADSQATAKTPPEDVVSMLKRLRQQCQALGLQTSRALLDGAIGRPPTTESELSIYVRAVNIELVDKLFLYVPPARSSYFDAHPSADVSLKFPSAVYDLDEAGKCLALERGTAAVFHSMMVVEHILIAINHCLGITTPLVGNDQNWGNILKRIKDEIASRSKWPEKDYFQELYARLDAVKDAWRNSTMHVEKKYTPDEAEEIFRLTLQTLEKAASKMDEQGNPKT